MGSALISSLLNRLRKTEKVEHAPDADMLIVHATRGFLYPMVLRQCGGLTKYWIQKSKGSGREKLAGPPVVLTPLSQISHDHS